MAGFCEEFVAADYWLVVCELLFPAIFAAPVHEHHAEQSHEIRVQENADNLRDLLVYNSDVFEIEFSEQ